MSSRTVAPLLPIAVLLLAACTSPGKVEAARPGQPAASEPVEPAEPVEPDAVPELARSGAPSAPLVAVAASGNGGLWLVAADGSVEAVDAADHGSVSVGSGERAVDVAPTSDGDGYRVAGVDGRVWGFGSAAGEVAVKPPGPRTAPVVGIASADGGGYWLVGEDGLVEAVGAPHHGSPALGEGQEVVDIAATPDGSGYWVAASDGQVWGFGSAAGDGAPGSVAASPTSPVVGITAAADAGAWVATADGTVTALGSAPSPPAGPEVMGDELVVDIAAHGSAFRLAVRERRSLRIAAAGDVLIHGPVYEAAARYGARSGEAHDFSPMFEPIREVVSAADLAICHLEVPLSRTDDDLSSYPSFNAPRGLASDLAEVGFDTCSTASNHSLDKGPDGVVSTIEALDEAGLDHAGTAASAIEAVTPVLYDVDGVTVGHVSFTYGFNGYRLPAGREWLANLLDPDAVLAAASAARAAGAEFVVASLHWGAEYQVEPTADQSALARQLLASPDMDLILGHHAHVVQPVERIDGEYVVYGLGNMLSNQCCERRQDGVIVTVELGETASGEIRAQGLAYTPTRVDRDTYLVLPTHLAHEPALGTAVRHELEDSARRTAEAIGLLGAHDQGVQPVARPGEGSSR